MREKGREAALLLGPLLKPALQGGARCLRAPRRLHQPPLPPHWSELQAHPDMLWQDPVSSSYWKHLGAMGACTPSLGKSTFALAPQESHGAALMAPPPCVQGVGIQWHRCDAHSHGPPPSWAVMGLLGLTQPQLLVLHFRDQQSKALQGVGDFPGLSCFGQDALVPPCSASGCDQGLAWAALQADFQGELVTALEVPLFPLWLLYIRDLTTNLSSALESESSKTQTEFVLEKNSFRQP